MCGTQGVFALAIYLQMRKQAEGGSVIVISLIKNNIKLDLTFTLKQLLLYKNNFIQNCTTEKLITEARDNMKEFHERKS